MERLTAQLTEAVAERDEWRKLHTADLEWLVQSCRLIEDSQAKWNGGGGGNWRGRAATAAGATVVARAGGLRGGGGGGVGGKKGGKPGGTQGGGGKVGMRPQQQPAPPTGAGPAQSEGSHAPEVLQVAEVLRGVAEVRSLGAGQRTRMEDLVLAVEALLLRCAKTYAGDLVRRRWDHTPSHSPRPNEDAVAGSAVAGSAVAGSEPSLLPPGVPPLHAPPAAPTRTPSTVSPAGPTRCAAAGATFQTQQEAGPDARQEARRVPPQGPEVRALRQQLARLQLDNQRLTGQLVACGGAPAPSAGADAHKAAGTTRLPALAAARLQDGSQTSAALRVSRPGRAEPGRQSLAQAHGHKPRPPLGGGAAGGWAEWVEPDAEPRPQRRRVPPMPSQSRLAAAEARLAAAESDAGYPARCC